MMGGYKTKHGFLGVDEFAEPQESLYEYLRKRNYHTGIITTSFLADATPAALYSHRTDRHEYEDIAWDFYQKAADFTVAGGQDHFDHRTDGKNLLDSLQNKGFHLFYNLNQLAQINALPALGMMDAGRPPYLSDGRPDFLYQATQKALDLFTSQPFFLFIEGAQIDLAGHDNDIENQVNETLELDRVAGFIYDYAQKHNNVLVLVIADHECGGLTLLSGEGNDYLANYADDNHSGTMIPIFSFGPGAAHFSGLQDNTEIYHHLKSLINYYSNL